MGFQRYVSWLATASVVLATGCTINHPVAEDYGQYLRNNQGASTFQQAKVADKYHLPPATQNHKYEFRSVLTGAANLWIVEFGKILDETMASKDVVEALGPLTRAGQEQAKAGDTLVFNLQDYVFADHTAQITLGISVLHDGTERFNKTYRANGLSQGGKMFWGGVFGMKNAVQQSTKTAMDQIIGDFIKDVRNELPDAVR